MIAALAGGVGAARFLQGLVQVVDPTSVVAIVNTADDVVLHGLHVSPDVDTVIYTLAGTSNLETGWGLNGETWAAMENLARFGTVAPPGSSAGLSWFRLGDRDLATHLYRTQRLREGGSLSEATAELASAWGIGLTVLPMSDEPVETRVDVPGKGEIGFQDYFVRHRHAVPVSAVRFAGADAARPAPGVLDSLRSADRIVICPSNPVVSIGPLLAVPGVAEVVEARRLDTVAISPIVAGAALKGPAARLMTELGHEASVVGVARLYRRLASTLVVDDADAGLREAVEAEGMRCIVTPTVMREPSDAATLARVVLETSGP